MTSAPECGRIVMDDGNRHRTVSDGVICQRLSKSGFEGGTMDWLQGTLIVVGLLALRVGVPLVATFALGYVLRRLAAR
jgi:hypothetical protein